jgi:CRP-like cAMP-binding protein
MADPKIQMLGRVPLFATCPTKSIELIAQLSDEVDVRDGYVLMRTGDLAQEFFLIIEGRVRIERNGSTLNTLERGDFLGEIALLAEDRRTATAVSEGPSKLLVLTRAAFKTLLDTSPEIRAAVMTAVAARIRRLEPDAVS